MSGFTPAPLLRPRPCVGSLLDIPAGAYRRGKHGDMILSGGFSNYIGVGGTANTFKTAFSLSMAIIILARYPEVTLRFYDTETTFSWDRIASLAARYPNIDCDVDFENGRIILTSAAEHIGEEWWEIVRSSGKERAKNSKKLQLPTPFVDKAGLPIKAFAPEIHILDSISEFKTSAIEEMHDKNAIDASGNNTDALRGGAIKTRMVMQTPVVTASGGLTMITTAHIGKEFKLDPYAPNVKDLSFMKTGLEFKYTPKKFTFLTSITWMVVSAAPLIHKTNKTSLYPTSNNKDIVGDTDLQELTLINLRSKHGPTGHVLKLIISQSEGLLPSLSEFHFLKNRKDKFGLIGPEGVHQDYRLILYPDVVLKRTSVRELVDSDPKLRRALEITSELAQIYEYWIDLPASDRIAPKDLYEKLKEMGYDWDLLLTTRGYWTFDHYENEVPPLTTLDLINMYHGRYVPFWYPNADKLKIPKKGNDDADAKSGD